MDNRDVFVAHADWGSSPEKRWLAVGQRDGGRYRAMAPEPAGAPGELLARLRGLAGGAPVLLGLDLPLGLPLAYADLAGVTDFPALLPRLGLGEWGLFYEPAAAPEEIGLRRPFYPRRPGGARREHLWRGLGLGGPGELWRLCDRGHSGRRAGCPLFWTLGAQQVGKAAISAWRDVIGPAMRAGADIAIWPCDGRLDDLLRPGRVVVAEVYPGECYGHLGVTLGPGGKRAQAARAAAAPALIGWAGDAGVTLAPELAAHIREGFGPRPEGDDPFDAAVGVLGMLNVLLGRREAGEPDDEELRKVEGWILGQRVTPRR